jgi:hypothetical protein
LFPNVAMAELDSEKQALLTAPGILRNPVAVRALYDRDAAHEAVLRNLLQRHGYQDLDAVRLTTIAETILTLLEGRNIDVDAQPGDRFLPAAISRPCAVG